MGIAKKVATATGVILLALMGAVTPASANEPRDGDDAGNGWIYPSGHTIPEEFHQGESVPCGVSYITAYGDPDNLADDSEMIFYRNCGNTPQCLDWLSESGYGDNKTGFHRRGFVYATHHVYLGVDYDNPDWADQMTRGSLRVSNVALGTDCNTLAAPGR